MDTTSYTITYMIQDTVYSEEKHRAGSTLFPPTVEQKPGFTFEWSDTVLVMPAENITIVGTYKPNGATALTAGTINRPYFAVLNGMIIAENIEFPAKAEFISLNGKVACSTTVTSGKTALPNISAGVYLVRFKSKTVNLITKSVLK